MFALAGGAVLDGNVDRLDRTGEHIEIRIGHAHCRRFAGREIRINTDRAISPDCGRIVGFHFQQSRGSAGQAIDVGIDIAVVTEGCSCEVTPGVLAGAGVRECTAWRIRRATRAAADDGDIIPVNTDRRVVAGVVCRPNRQAFAHPINGTRTTTAGFHVVGDKVVFAHAHGNLSAITTRRHCRASRIGTVPLNAVGSHHRIANQHAVAGVTHHTILIQIDVDGVVAFDVRVEFEGAGVLNGA